MYVHSLGPCAQSKPPTLQQARHKDRIVGVTWLSLEAVELNPGSIYEARLRVQMTLLEEDDMAEERSYTSHWSEWSQPVSFPSPQRWRQGECSESLNTESLRIAFFSIGVSPNLSEFV